MNKNKLQNAILGTILGDSYLDGNVLRFVHASKDAAYAQYKYDLLAPHTLKSKITHNVTRSCTFGIQSVSLARLTFSSDILDKFRGFRKTSDWEYESLSALSSLGLLLLWLDDGSLTVRKVNRGRHFSVSRQGYLNNHGMSHVTKANLEKVLLDKFNINVKYHKNSSPLSGNTFLRFYLSATSMRALIDAVRPHIPFIPECMLRKVNMRYEQNSLKNSEMLEKLYNFSTLKRGETGSTQTGNAVGEDIVCSARNT